MPVLENGPYVVFAPTNEAFAAMEPGQLDALKADPGGADATLDYYHVFLGLLGPDDVTGQRPTQQGTEIKVDRQGRRHQGQRHRQGRLRRRSAPRTRRIYMIDTVLDPNERRPDADHAVGRRRRTDHHHDATTSDDRRRRRHRGTGRRRLRRG